MSQAPGRVVVVDHHDSYVWNLVHLIAAVTGVIPEVVQHDEVDAAYVLGFDRVVLSPGPGNPAQAADFAVGAEVLRAGTTPVFGVCLGMQGLVTAFGGTVDRIEPAHGEVALIDHDGTSVFGGLPSPFEAVRYHSLAATEVPDALTVTATCAAAGTESGGTRVVMGVRHRELPLHGVQFHPESILSRHGQRLIANFLENPDG